MGDCYITRKTQPYTTFSTDGNFQYPENFTIPAHVISLSDSERCFKNHTEIKNIFVDNNSRLKLLASNCFSGCTNLVKVDFSNAYNEDDMGCFTINNNAFKNCYNLLKIIFNNDCYISFNSCTGAFYNCKSLTDNVVNDILQKAVKGSTKLSNCGQMFLGCTSLKNIEIPEGYTEISSAAFFSGCSSLESVSFPSTLKTFSASSFCSNCTALKSITFNGVLTSFSYAVAVNSNNLFYGLKTLEEVVLPKGWNLSILISNGAANFTNVLTHDSMVAMFNNLATVETATLTLGATNLSRLTEEEQAVAKGKGWTLA